jgi:hypothetical protein
VVGGDPVTGWHGFARSYIGNPAVTPRGKRPLGTTLPLGEAFFRLAGRSRVVRPWLVIIGVAILTLTVGALASLYLPSGPGPSTTVHTYTTLPVSAPARASGSSQAVLPVNDSSTFLLTWSSTVSLNVSWGTAAPCTPGLQCSPPLPPLAAWSDRTNGTWSYAGHLTGPLYLQWFNPGRGGGSIGFTLRQTVTSSSSFPGVGPLLVDASLGILAIIGALALFLGAFLRGGVYRGPAPLVSQDADDAEGIADPAAGDAIGPRTGPSSGGSEAPRQTPAAPPGKAPPS